MRIDGDKAVLKFEHVGGGLVAKGDADKLVGFAIAGADKKFIWADAKIAVAGTNGDTRYDVIVSSKSVRKPVAVRYGWGTNPECNLYNKEGLPASPFRTDDWPGITKDTMAPGK